MAVILTFSSHTKLKKPLKITFLDVIITRTENNKLETTIFRKELNTDFYINRNSHAPIQWKRGSLMDLIQRSMSVCSKEKLIEDELNYLRNVYQSK